MTWIPLSRGFCTQVDDADAEWVRQWRWHAHDRGNNGIRRLYASRTEKMVEGAKGVRKRKTISLHRELMGLKYGDKAVVDHLNGDSLDNRRANLKVVSQHENMAREPRWKTKKKPEEPYL